MFDRFRLRVLKGPKNIYRKAEQIYSIARKVFRTQHLFVATLLGNIHLSDTEISSLMRAIEESRGTEQETVCQWIDAHWELVNSWIPDREEYSR